MNRTELTTAKKRALYLLGSRDHSSAELYKKLTRNYSAEISEEVVEWVKELGYTDDRKYGEKLVRRLLSKSYGERKIRYELKQKGISEDLVNELCVFENENVRGEIKKYIEKKYGGNLDDYKEKQKAISALIRRGFDYEDIKTCILGVEDFD